ncbi:MAG: PH domain-containing protein [Thermotogaceae bacterium]|nr:PH domain-containing protein [Thermotogaceae bacterium]
MVVPKSFMLVDGEEVLWHGHRSYRSIFGSIMLGLILLGIIVIPAGLSDESLSVVLSTFLILGLILGLLFFLIVAPFVKLNSEYTITNKRIVSRYGIFSRKLAETTLDRITDISLRQGLLGMLLNYGTVKVNTAGSTKYEIVFEGVADPKQVIALIRKVSEEYKNNKQNATN